MHHWHAHIDARMVINESQVFHEKFSETAAKIGRSATWSPQWHDEKMQRREDVRKKQPMKPPEDGARWIHQHVNKIDSQTIPNGYLTTSNDPNLLIELKKNHKVPKTMGP